MGEHIRCAAIAAIVLVSAGRAEAARCASLASWAVSEGTLAHGAACSTFVLTADGSSRSTGAAALVEMYEGDATLALTWRRLSADEGTLEIQFSGGWFLFQDGKVGIYVTEAQWQESGFRELPEALAGRREVDASAVEVELRGERVVVRIDGVEVIAADVPGRAREGRFSVWIRGPAGTRSRLRISDVTLRSGDRRR